MLLEMIALRLVASCRATDRPSYGITYRNLSWLPRNGLGDVCFHMKNQLSCLPEHIPLRLGTRSFLNAPRNERIAFLIINSKTTVRPLYKIRYRHYSWFIRNDLGD